jgi:hypothetical protein
MEKAKHAFKRPTLGHSPEQAAFGRGFAFGMEPASTAPRSVPPNLERFSPFSSPSAKPVQPLKKKSCGEEKPAPTLRASLRPGLKQKSVQAF